MQSRRLFDSPEFFEQHQMAFLPMDSNHRQLADTKEPYYSEVIRSMFKLNSGDPLPTFERGSESNISYHPNSMEHAQVDRLPPQLYTCEDDLPIGWPREVAGPIAWKPHEFSDGSEFIHLLTPKNIAEINEALRFFNAQSLPLDAVTKLTFPLPEFSRTLLAIRDQVYTGIGFALLRGLHLNAYNPTERAVIFLGLSSYIAEERGPQDRYGTMLKHIMDDERSESWRDLPFHTDVTCDVSAILTNRCSDRGGMWTVASSFTVYNELARDRPDLVRVLAEPNWPFDTFGRNPPFYCRAPLYFLDGKVIFNFSRRLLAGHPKSGRTPGVPRLTETQADALDAIHFTAHRHHMKIAMEEGDVRFINNFGLLHGRQGFYDDKSTESQRHVMRLWLRNREMSWKLPPALQLAWARVFDDKERLTTWIVAPFSKDGVIYGRGPRTECD